MYLTAATVRPDVSWSEASKQCIASGDVRDHCQGHSSSALIRWIDAHPSSSCPTRRPRINRGVFRTCCMRRRNRLCPFTCAVLSMHELCQHHSTICEPLARPEVLTRRQDDWVRYRSGGDHPVTELSCSAFVMCMRQHVQVSRAEVAQGNIFAESYQAETEETWSIHYGFRI